MDIITISQEIRSVQTEMNKIRAVIKDRAIAQAVAVSDYDKQLCIEIIKLKNLPAGEKITALSEEITGTIPVTLIEKIAKGKAHEVRLKMDTATALYKSATSNLHVLELQLTSLQSLLRRMD